MAASVGVADTIETDARVADEAVELLRPADMSSPETQYTPALDVASEGRVGLPVWDGRTPTLEWYIRELACEPVDLCARPEESKEDLTAEERPWRTESPTPQFAAWRAGSALLSGRKDEGISSASSAVSAINLAYTELPECGFELTKKAQIASHPQYQDIMECYKVRCRKMAAIYLAHPVPDVSRVLDYVTAALVAVRRQAGDAPGLAQDAMERAWFCLLQRDGTGAKSALSSLSGVVSTPVEVYVFCDFMLSRSATPGIRRAAYGHQLELLKQGMSEQWPGFEDPAYLTHLVRTIKQEGLQLENLSSAHQQLDRDRIWGGQELLERYQTLITRYNALTIQGGAAAEQHQQLRRDLEDLLCDCPTAQAWDQTLELLTRSVWSMGQFRDVLVLQDLQERSAPAPAGSTAAEMEGDALMSLGLELLQADQDPGRVLNLFERAASRSPQLEARAQYLRARVLESGPPEMVLDAAFQVLTACEDLQDELPPIVARQYPTDFLARVYDLIALQFERMPQQDLAASQYHRRAAEARSAVTGTQETTP
ncbi:MAG: hypothetical protein H6678_06245 [Candidatus Delongbacteria bacterium]|nr:hypothetical protein [Candidatus Delongbacteria bacterium]